MFLALFFVTVGIETHYLLAIVFDQRIVTIILGYMILALNNVLLLWRKLYILNICDVFLWSHSRSHRLFFLILLLHEELCLILRNGL